MGTDNQSFDASAIAAAARAHMAKTRADLEQLVRIPSVSAAAFDQSIVAASAEAVAQLAREAGLADVQILTADRPDGTPGAPAVVAHRPAPAGKPTVLLYAHHDVQPPGNESDWNSVPFEPTERDGRLYGRGTADDKAGVMAHLTALRTLLPTWGDDEGLGVTLFIEGEEEIGSPSFTNFLETYRDQLDNDVIIVADSDNWTVDTPALTTSLRGNTIMTVTVKTLGWAQHSGVYGGAVPDAIMALTVLLSRLWDDTGDLAVQDLLRAEAPILDYTEEQLRKDTGLLEGVQPIGDGTLLSRMWTRPSLTIIGTDFPTIEKASNTLYGSATAKLSLRVSPSQDPRAAFQAVRDHLMATAPFGAHVEVELVDAGRGFAGNTDSPVYAKAQWALQEAWGGTESVFQGMGGSIPFIAELQDVFPASVVLVTGVEDPDTRAHGANESLHLAMFEKACVAETLLLAKLAAEGLS